MLLYANDDSIISLPFSNTPYLPSEIQLQESFTTLKTYVPPDDDQVKFFFKFDITANFLERGPDTVLMGLAKIGGLLGLIKIMGIFKMFNRSAFEKEYSSNNKVDNK